MQTCERFENRKGVISLGKWFDSDTSAHSGYSSSKVAAAEHQARDDATSEGIFSRGDNEKNRQPLSRDDDSGKAAMSFWDSIFGRK